MVYRKGKRAGKVTNKTVKKGEDKYEQVDTNKINSFKEEVVSKIFKNQCENWEIPEKAQKSKNDLGLDCYIVYKDQDAFEKIDKTERKRKLKKADRETESDSEKYSEGEMSHDEEGPKVIRDHCEYHKEVQNKINNKFQGNKGKRVSVNDNHSLRKITCIDKEAVIEEELKKYCIVKKHKKGTKYYFKGEKNQT